MRRKVLSFEISVCHHVFFFLRFQYIDPNIFLNEQILIPVLLCLTQVLDLFLVCCQKTISLRKLLASLPCPCEGMVLREAALMALQAQASTLGIREKGFSSFYVLAFP